MRFSGFQKLTLLDYPGKVACTVFTAGCNFLCPFCHNASLVTHINKDQYYKEEEIIEYLQKRKGLLEGVCISGGEPLLHKELPSFIETIKSLGYYVKLDTNGSFPNTLKSLVNNGLIDYVAMDIKNSKEKYPITIGEEIDSFNNIIESVDFLLRGNVDYEFRTTIVKELHTIEDVEKLSQWISGAPKYFLQNFVESDDLIGDNLSAVAPETLEIMRDIALNYVKHVEIRGL